MTFATRLKDTRKARKITQIELGKSVGLSQGSIANLESGVTQPPTEILDLARALQVTPEYLAYGTGKPQAEGGMSDSDRGYRHDPADEAMRHGADVVKPPKKISPLKEAHDAEQFITEYVSRLSPAAKKIFAENIPILADSILELCEEADPAATGQRKKHKR